MSLAIGSEQVMDVRRAFNAEAAAYVSKNTPKQKCCTLGSMQTTSFSICRMKRGASVGQKG